MMLPVFIDRHLHRAVVIIVYITLSINGSKTVIDQIT